MFNCYFQPLLLTSKIKIMKNKKSDRINVCIFIPSRQLLKNIHVSQAVHSGEL